MSIIFQSLQKLDLLLNSEQAGGNGGTEPSPAPSSVNWRRIRPVAIGLALVLILGCGAVYAVAYLGERLGPEPAAPAMPSRPAAMGRVPSLPRTDASSDPTLEAVYRIPPVNAEDKEAPPAQVRFYPPDDRSVPETASSDHASRPPVPEDTPKAATAEPDAPSLIASVKKPPVTGIQEQQPEAKAIDAVPTDTTQLKAMERRRSAALEKSARIGRLVRQVEQAMANGGDRHRIESLLNELAHIKGPEQPFVVKLRACWLFRQGDYDSAATEFEKVLSADPQDREAGINVALIEVHQGQTAKAVKRLKRLLDVYPDDARIADLLKRLR